ncbi:MAG: ImmA/IrrE family metallo-endopeptidase [Micropepsaceae bacterium]
MKAELALRMRMARQKAEAFLRQEGLLDKLPIDPFAIAASRGIFVRAKPPTEAGASGMLLRHGNQFGIMYATHIPNLGFQRFSVAHELGHFFLEGHPDQVLQNGVHSSYAGYASQDPYELEADSFASGLLLPETPVKRLLRLNDAGLAIIERIADDFQVSLTATAIRYAELTPDTVAVIVSSGHQVEYCFLSSAMKALPKLEWLRKGTGVPFDTATYEFNQDATNIKLGRKVAHQTDVRKWLGGDVSQIVTEEVVGLGAYGKTLTVLSSSINVTEEEDPDDEEEALIESWTPRFRR